MTKVLRRFADDGGASLRTFGIAEAKDEAARRARLADKRGVMGGDR